MNTGPEVKASWEIIMFAGFSFLFPVFIVSKCSCSMFVVLINVFEMLLVCLLPLGYLWEVVGFAFHFDFLK